jgi:hypothetical protein
METRFYVYGHYTRDTNELFYVGKGTRHRAWSHDKRSTWWVRIVNKHGLQVKLLFEQLTEEEAHTKEIELIKQYGRRNNKTGILVNLTEGGEGISGYNHTKITRKSISNKLIGRTLSEKHKEAISRSHKGKIMSALGKSNMRERMKRQWDDGEYREKVSDKIKNSWTNERRKTLSAARKNKPLSKSTRLKISTKLTGKKMSEETKEKIRKSNSGKGHPMYGKPRSEETKRKMSETMKKKHLDKQKNL